MGGITTSRGHRKISYTGAIQVTPRRKEFDGSHRALTLTRKYCRDLSPHTNIALHMKLLREIRSRERESYIAGVHYTLNHHRIRRGLEK